ncbi:MAG TPA: hypothetical protein VGL42_12320 [Opitutaceae bacterium]
MPIDPSGPEESLPQFMSDLPEEISPGPIDHGYFLQGKAKAELQIHCRFSELMLQSREIEDQTRIEYLGRQVQLWEALKSLAETCFSLWGQADPSRRDVFIREALAIKERCADEGEDLVMAALANPVEAKSIARVLLLGHNFLRTLDICLEALLRYPSQKSLTRKPVRTEVVIDWAVGGIREWVCNFPYSFEKAAKGRKTPQKMAHVTRHYSTDRSARSQISHKQIANIFLLRDTTIADLERRGLSHLRASLEGDQSGTFNLDELKN